MNRRHVHTQKCAHTYQYVESSNSAAKARPFLLYFTSHTVVYFSLFSPSVATFPYRQPQLSCFMSALGSHSPPPRRLPCTIEAAHFWTAKADTAHSPWHWELKPFRSLQTLTDGHIRAVCLKLPTFCISAPVIWSRWWCWKLLSQ